MSWRFEQRPAAPQYPRPGAPFDRWRLARDGSESAQFFRDGRDFFVRFHDQADFAITVADRCVTATPVDGLADEGLADLYFNQVLPLVMGYDGDLVLHASAVAIEGRAAAFLGPTGMGKSTLATAFAASGHPFLTDDGLILDPDEAGYTARARRPFLRLCGDSAAALLPKASRAHETEEGKGRITAGPDLPHRPDPAPLAAIFCLTDREEPGRPAIDRLPAPHVVSILLQHSFLLDVEDKARIAAHFDRLIALAERTRCYRLDYPRRYDRLPDVLAAVTTVVSTTKDNA